MMQCLAWQLQVCNTKQAHCLVRLLDLKLLTVATCMLCYTSDVPSIVPRLACRCRTTHWKQTVLYLEDTLVICQGEAITGGRPHCPLSWVHWPLSIEQDNSKHAFSCHNLRCETHTEKCRCVPAV